jgi:hypothetical protein
MLIKIGDKIYDPKTEIIAIFINETDRQALAKLPPECSSILVAPPGTPVEVLEEFMAYVDVILGTPTTDING